MSIFIRAILLLCACIFNVSSQASVTVGGTRLIYHGAEKEASLSVSNSKDANPYLIQSWLEVSEESSKKTPFIVTPPLFRLDGGHENTLRVIYAGDGALPGDRESLFWLNVKSIPSMEKSNQNRLLIAVKTRIKLFYRPAELSNEKASEAWRKLNAIRNGKLVIISNPTPFYISLFSLRIEGNVVNHPPMISPFGTVSITGQGDEVFWTAINDYGGVTQESRLVLK
ncbi:fimbrial biogenesis chaperone [Type-E symbiont of Plautia stali]|uniref:fimbrial biogenesis chaperone n=1 Tax=Type-E symbiont of Plautia stali TaxID=1560357 RepID=UPI00073E6035|nr:molecular chaperone [Type-E symbiont of Plautia stali]